MEGGRRSKYRSTTSAALKKSLSSYGYGRTFKDTKYDILGKSVPTSMRLDAYRGNMAKVKSDLLGPAYNKVLKRSKSKSRKTGLAQRAKTIRQSRTGRSKSKGRKRRTRKRSRSRSKSKKRRTRKRSKRSTKRRTTRRRRRSQK